MAARFPSDLLDRPAQESSRLVALRYLDQIHRAQRRLEQPGDPEALHDFRVGLRRLRSCIRAYRVQLQGSVTDKMERRLRKLMLTTNAGRDTEVQLSWLRKQAGRLGAEDAHGLFWLMGRLEGHKYEALDPTTAEVGRRFVKTATKLRRRLATLRIEIVAGPEKRQPAFGQVTGKLIHAQVARLKADLKRLSTAANVKQAHKVRIAVKRLRYLLEPVARRTARARGLITRLKEAQDLLGELHDMHVLSEEIATSLAALSGNSPESLADSEPGLRTLQRLAGEQAAAAFESFNTLWGGERASRLLAAADEVAKSLPKRPPRISGDVARLRLAGSRDTEPPAGTGPVDQERVV